jgi:hypothetical protein
VAIDFLGIDILMKISFPCLSPPFDGRLGSVNLLDCMTSVGRQIRRKSVYILVIIILRHMPLLLIFICIQILQVNTQRRLIVIIFL